MKKRSITTKITIWYTIFLLVLVGCFLAILVYTGNLQAGELARTRLVDSVTDASGEIEAVGPDFIIDDDLNFYDGGVYLGVYNEDQELLEGRRPAELSQLPSLKDGEVRKLKDETGEIWYVYDRLFQLEDRPVWVRGIVKDFAQGSSFSFTLRLAAVGFPILVILAALGGYLITRRGFRPIRKILETVEEISRDGDLSRRILLEDSVSPEGSVSPEDSVSSEGSVSPEDRSSSEPNRIVRADQDAMPARDEIHQLANTFNGMFEKLEETFEKEKQFTSDVSHELRTPLAVILSQSDYALEDKAYQTQALQVIRREAGRMSGLVNRLLTLARSDAGSLKLKREHLDFSRLCESIGEQQKAIAREMGIELVTEIAPDIQLEGDEDMLIRILLNLMENAFKYGRQEGQPGWVRLSLEKNENTVRCRVEDRGPGLSSQHLSRIWERFYRADPSRSQEGAGLGLSLVKAMTEAHGGHVFAENNRDGGCCFTVELPLELIDVEGAEDEK